MSKIIACDIMRLLTDRHSKDLCIPECKTGPTIYASACPRLDLVAIPRSWAHPYVYGYEIKVSRGDFIQDTKWTSYLDYCTDFYFVATPGVIDKSEVSPEAGLLVTSKNGKRLFTVKKAPTRDVEIPRDLFWYILICRSMITKYDIPDSAISCNSEYWKKWIEQRDENKAIGHTVSKKIREIINMRIDRVEKENQALQRAMDDLKDIRQFVLGLGFSEKDILCGIQWQARRKIEELISGIPQGTVNAIHDSLHSLKKIYDEIVSIQGIR